MKISLLIKECPRVQEIAGQARNDDFPVVFSDKGVKF
jgi:hypothetical protein